MKKKPPDEEEEAEASEPLALSYSGEFQRAVNLLWNKAPSTKVSATFNQIFSSILSAVRRIFGKSKRTEWRRWVRSRRAAPLQSRKKKFIKC